MFAQYVRQGSMSALIDELLIVWLQHLDKVTNEIDQESRFPIQAGQSAPEPAPFPKRLKQAANQNQVGRLS